jgi:hypothetical protein
MNDGWQYCDNYPHWFRSTGEICLYQFSHMTSFSTGNYYVFVSVSRPPLWSSGQNFWLQIRRPGFDSWHYQEKTEVDLERDPLSLVSTTEELLERKSSGSGLENRGHGRRDPSLWPRGTLYPQKLAIASPTSGGRILRSRTQTMEFVCFLFLSLRKLNIYMTPNRY